MTVEDGNQVLLRDQEKGGLLYRMVEDGKLEWGGFALRRIGHQNTGPA